MVASKTSFLFALYIITVPFLLIGQVVRGVIYDERGEPIPFAKVHVKNSSYGTFSNSFGKYQLALDEGSHTLVFSATGFNPLEVSISISKETTLLDPRLEPLLQETQEVVIYSRSKRDKGREIMKEVIRKRSEFQDLLKEYSTESYCFASLEKDQVDTLFKDSIIGKEKLNLLEWNARSYFKHPNRFKDVFYAYQDYSDKKSELGSTVSVGVNISGLNEGIVPKDAPPINPYLFINGIQDFHFSVFDNAIKSPNVTKSPLVSPLAFNAFMYYIFYLESSFIDKDGQYIHEVRVEPRFEFEPLFYGTLYIKREGWELQSYELGINPKSMHFFEEMLIVCDYTKEGERLVPTRREFIYAIKEGKSIINGLIRLQHSNYTFEIEESKRRFWQETQSFKEDAFDKDSSFWNTRRPIPLKPIEKQFISEQDSIINHLESDEYKRKRDSSRNEITFLGIVFGGVGRVNSFKGYELFLPGLINQVVPFGVGGYRHKLDPNYTQTFKNGKKLFLNPSIDYGFRNKDVRGGLSASYMYNTLNFSQLGFDIGDTYDFITANQNIQGTLAPANRIRNQKAEVNFRREITNGLYGQGIAHFSDRTDISDIEYPDWVGLFGVFQEPQPFDQYKILLGTVNLEYHFRQRFITRQGRKYVLGTTWPVVKFQYRKALPNILRTEANFDYVELSVHDDIDFGRWGQSEVNFLGGAFLQKQDLRIIEHRFFRPSDRYFFSNPVHSLQLLDTALNTSNSFAQLNFIHHFKGYFLNKIWGINRLKLEETIGGGLLLVPENNFAQAEFYVGLQRMFRIRKTLFKLGVYGVSQVNSIDGSSINLKFGINFYNAFRDKWDY
jgi:hypothetical protein